MVHILNITWDTFFTEQTLQIFTAVQKVGIFWEKFLGLIKPVSIWWMILNII